MSDVKRYWLAWSKPRPDLEEKAYPPGMKCSEWRTDAFVLAEDYDALEAEAQALSEELNIERSRLGVEVAASNNAARQIKALREEVAAANDRADTLEHRMMGMMTRHFAEAWCKRDTEKALDGYLSAGIAELERERDAALAEVAALRARVVVIPDRLEKVGIADLQSAALVTHANAWNACLDELARLNGKAVSEGLLRRVSDLFPADMGDDGSGRAGWLPHVRETVAELRDLLGEGKEHE